MKSTRVKNILKGDESNMSKNKAVQEEVQKMKSERKEQIDTIQDALDEKRIREIQNLELRLEKDRLCAEMANIDAINNILSSTGDNEIGCPINGDIKKKIDYRPVTCQPVKQVKEVCREVVCPKEEVIVEEVHGEGCHCEKCCPNPKPNWFQKNKKNLGISAIWVIMIILALGISPQGAWATFLQESWVNLFVDFFKMSLFVIAGIITFKSLKEKDKED